MSEIDADDAVYEVNTVWLGPAAGGSSMTLPWTARYLAYAVWIVLFLAILLGEAVTPLTVGVPPVWEIVISTFATYVVLGLVDHEKPIVSLFQTLMAELRAPRPPKKQTVELHDRSTTVGRYAGSVHVYRRHS